MQELPNSDAEAQDSVKICKWANQICEQPNHHGCKDCDDEPTHRSCGCPLDYHLSDCPIITPPGELDYEEYYERDWYTRSLNGDY